MDCQESVLVQKILDLYGQISKLESLKPSENVNTLFSQLVTTCIPPNPIDVTKMCHNVQEIRSKLIKLCGEAEGHLETHFSILLATYQNPLHHLTIFPYYSNYIKLGELEFNLLSKHYRRVPDKIAFVGSGPLPLTSVVLATSHLPETCFYNYDIDPEANSLAQALVSSDSDLSTRMFFHTTDIMDVTTALNDYDVVFLAALVGMDKEEKVRVIDHLATHMAPGAMLMLRSAHGARGFLYPVVDLCDLKGFEVLTVYHPTDDIINSVLVARKDHDHNNPENAHSSIDQQQQQQQQQRLGCMIMPCNCSKMNAFNPLNKGKIMIEDLMVDEQLS